jgi:precorrin-8X/cobalt-precorrin-8 methylmutase
MTHRHEYLRDGVAIYKKSFAIIREEADLRRFSTEQARVAVRIVHACGMTEITQDLHFSDDFTGAAHQALLLGKPIFCDAAMVAHGINRSRLPAHNDVVCTLNAPDVATRARILRTTRSAAALELWGERLAGALVVIGNAPTALYHLLEMLYSGAPMPAAAIGMPVGFVGAAEAKEALVAYGRVPFLIVSGRKGGSAMAAAAVNALAQVTE